MLIKEKKKEGNRNDNSGESRDKEAMTIKAAPLKLAGKDQKKEEMITVSYPSDGKEY